MGHFIKRYWKPIVIAVAAYFTCGMALAAMAPAATGAAVAADAGATAFAGATASASLGADAMFTSMATATAADVATGAAAASEAGFAATDAAGVAGSLGSFGGGVATDLGIEGAGTAAEAGSGVLSSSALEGTAAEGAATVGGGSMAPGAVGAMQNAMQQTAMGALDQGAAGGADIASDIGAGAYNDAAGSIAEGASNMTPSVANVTETSASGGFAPDVVNGAGGFMSRAADAGKGFWDGMSGGQKLQLAGTLFNAAAGFFQPGPTRAQQGLWPGGAYFGMDEKGNGTNLGNVYANEMTGSSLPTAIAGGKTQAPPTIQPQSGPPAASSEFLPAAGPGASNAQSATASQTNTLSQAASRNADFIQSTMQRLSPNASPAKSSS